MKTKKWLTFITIGVSAISLICAIIANCCCVKLMYDISMAIFGSGLLGFIMSLIEYFGERRNAMEAFFTAVYKVYAQLRNIKLLELDQPSDLIIDCIREEQNNKIWGQCDGETAKILGFNAVHKSRDAYINWMQENEVMSFSETDDIKSILIKVYNERITNYINIFTKYGCDGTIPELNARARRNGCVSEYENPDEYYDVEQYADKQAEQINAQLKSFAKKKRKKRN